MEKAFLLFGLMVTLTIAPAFAAEVPLKEKVQAHLQAGEFGPALALAQTAADPAERTALLQQIAAAEGKAGEFRAAATSARRIPQASDREEQKSSNSRQRTMNGGGTDLTFLIQLIQEQTGGGVDGPWLAVDGSGGTISLYPPSPQGVKVDAKGVLSLSSQKEANGQLQASGQKARKAALNTDLAKSSRLRIVSLTRLEKEVSRMIAAGDDIPDSMLRIAGLTRVQYVFFDPAQSEVLLAGPAEGWQFDQTGYSVGVASGRPTLNLDDLVVLLRTYFSGKADFGCSINTRDEGVRNLQQYVQASLARGPLPANAVSAWVGNLQKKLGRQDIEIWGVPDHSRIARVIVDADYKMKLIGVERLKIGKEIPSYFALLPQSLQKDPPAMEALRWWLTLSCDTVLHSEDRTAFEFQGTGVKCLSENQLLTAEGKHLPTGVSEPTNRQFAENFTRNYHLLETRESVFADAANIFDLALAACLIQQEVKAGRVKWELGEFAAEGEYHPAVYAPPKEIDSVVNHKVYNGKDIVVQVAGGVHPNPRGILSDGEKQPASPRIGTIAKKAQPQQLPEGRWWWDAAE